MPSRSLSVTVSMPIELDEQIQNEADKHGLDYSKYVRAVLRNSTETPFDPSENIDLVVDDRDAEEAQMGGA